jgi:hypothetical protein
VTELFVMAVWVIHLAKMATHIAFDAQTFRITPVMKKLRTGILPVGLVLLGLAPFAQAHGIAAPQPAGAAVEERALLVVPHDGISLDEAVSRAERQYKARVVRTDVQDEDGRKVYVLKLLSDNGRVFTVRVDAQTGRSR